MNQLAIRYGMLAMQAKEAAVSRLKDERGEISSWLILAAGLALVAIFIGDTLLDWAEGKIEEITTAGD